MINKIRFSELVAELPFTLMHPKPVEEAVDLSSVGGEKGGEENGERTTEGKASSSPSKAAATTTTTGATAGAEAKAQDVDTNLIQLDT